MESRNIIQVLHGRARSDPGRNSHTFADAELTYAQLDLRARAIAAHLQDMAEPGDRALLLYPPGPDFISAFLGCLYARVVAVPACPPRGNQGLGRIESIRNDATPRVVLTPDETAGLNFEKLAGKWHDTTSEIRDDTLAYLQYTSGSSSDPKGVMVSHGNLMSNLLDMHLGWEHDANSVLVSWLPHFHDMGLVYGLLGPLYLGIPGHIMSPLTFIQRPIRWLQAISSLKATHSVAPNFAYELCLRKVAPEDRDGLDLSSWAVAVNGAEPVRKDTLDRFAEFFEPCGFRYSAFCPGYGLAEATLKVTATGRNEIPTTLLMPNKSILVGNGRSMIGTQIAIVDPETRRRSPNHEAGEIWVSGPAVAAGYWNKPELNAATFEARIADTDEGPFLRTGDLGLIEDGQLYVTGRLKDLIVIRGQNHYPQDIEATSEQSHSAMRQPGYCAAFGVDVSNEERLVVVQELERKSSGMEAESLIGTVRQAISEAHELQAYDVVLVKAGTLPKTSSGKIRRQACKLAYLEHQFQEARQ